MPRRSSRPAPAVPKRRASSNTPVKSTTKKSKYFEPESSDEPATEPSNSDGDALKGRELWREGVRTGLGPGKEVFIPKPRARDAGDVAYRDETLHPNTRLFLLDLAENNEREWLKGGRASTKPARLG